MQFERAPHQTTPQHTLYHPLYPKGVDRKAKLLTEEYEIVICKDTNAKRVVAIALCDVMRFHWKKESDRVNTDDGSPPSK